MCEISKGISYYVLHYIRESEQINPKTSYPIILNSHVSEHNNQTDLSRDLFSEVFSIIKWNI